MVEQKIWREEDARRCIATPTSTDDKYSRGVLGVISGSREYPGAAVLTCEGAMQTGVGMVRYFGPRIARFLVLRQRPEVVIQAGQVQAWLIGSGIESAKLERRRRNLIRSAMDQQIPLLLDAGAISFTAEIRSPTLITPHFRELASLLADSQIGVEVGEIARDPMKWAKIAADKFNVTVLLKGHETVVASTNSSIKLPPGTPWLASAGTGDVLSGILGALVATHAERVQNEPEFLVELAATGSLIHSGAATLASQGGPLVALQLSIAVPQFIRKLLSPA
ncbi:MAG: NAD(P)H-hydrate dehydratase [Actinobacteria bacterium]|nr:NAD(P)H-hydrate dehydratase [Actinomycetota bacterium]